MSEKIIKSKVFFEEDFIEQMAEVPAEDFKAWETKDLKIIGTEVPRIDAYDKVSGSAKFTADIVLPRMAHAKTLRSPFPNAVIKRIDIKEALQLDGVYHILTFENTPEIKWYYGTTALFDKHVRHQGDEVACVAAVDEYTAEQALKLIKVEYEQLPFVTDKMKAVEKDAPKVHDWGNVLDDGPAKYSRGSVENGLKEADVVFEDTYETQVVVHNPTEPMCSVVNWDGGKLTVYDSTQVVFTVRDSVADSLGLPQSDVRVIKKYMGGGFGSKLEAGKYTVMAALLARETGRPIKIVYDRKEMNLAAGNRPDSLQIIKGGVKKDGTLTALKLISYGSVGAYPSGGGCGWPFKTMYKCANLEADEYSVLTNFGRARAYRAPGHVQGTFAFESFMDDIAERIKMDPVDFRIKNFADTDQTSKNPYTSKKLLEAYEAGKRMIGWEKRNKVPGSGSGYIKRGIGAASQIWWGGGGPPAYATLEFNRDGSAVVISGTQDLGTGTYTFIAMIAAEVLEIPIEKVNVILGDTGVAPFGPSSGGSMTAPSISPAVKDAAEKMKAKLLSGAAAMLNVPEDTLTYKNAVISTAGENPKSITAAEVVQRMRERVLITTGSRNANPDGYAINTFGAQFADVEVDTLTGKVKVIKIAAAHDIGRVLNKKTMLNQMHGGIIQGLGYALLEERAVDHNEGKVISTNLHNYKVPTIMDTPEIEVDIVSEADPLNSGTGVKGVGEPAIIPTAAAIANAVYNAIGVRIKSLPITPDKVLNALYLKKN